MVGKSGFEKGFKLCLPGKFCLKRKYRRLSIRNNEKTPRNIAKAFFYVIFKILQSNDFFADELSKPDYSAISTIFFAAA